ncbi:MAG: VanW family protein [Alkaliphilus sp.]
MKKVKWALLFVIAITTLGLIICTVFCTLVLMREEIYHNIYVEHVNVGDLSKEEAIDKIERVFKNELKERRIRLYYNENEWEFTYGTLGYSYLYEKAIDKAFSVGRRGNLSTRLRKIFSLRNKPLGIELEGIYNDKLTEVIILEIDNVVRTGSIDASIIRTNGNFIITNEILGTKLDRKILKERIAETINNYKLQDIEIPILFTSPRITREKLLVIQEVIGQYTTEFDSAVVGRSKNILLASSKFDGTLLMTGEALSFNKQTGRRTAQAGYQVAPVILDGELVPAIGGGICQVSSTLYAAVLRADLEVIQRQNHSMAVSYMHIGQDATVSYGFIDFEFANSKKYPVFLESYVEGNKLTIEFYGNKTNDIHIEIHSVIVSEIERGTKIIEDSNMYLGESEIKRKGRTGFRVNTYKIYMRNNVEIKRELITRDFYPPLYTIRIEGTKQASN